MDGYFILGGFKILICQGKKVYLSKFPISLELFISPLDRAFVSASENGNLELAKHLAEEGANIKVKNNNAIKLASYNGHLSIVKYLIQKGVDFATDNNYIIMLASQNGHLSIVKYLVELGADFTANDNFSVRVASHKGYLEIVKYLVELGADFTAEDDYALRLASECKHLKIVKYLLSPDKKRAFRANIGARSNNPIRIPTSGGSIDMVKYLISQGANIDSTLVARASENGHLKWLNI